MLVFSEVTVRRGFLVVENADERGAFNGRKRKHLCAFVEARSMRSAPTNRPTPGRSIGPPRSASGSGSCSISPACPSCGRQRRPAGGADSRGSRYPSRGILVSPAAWRSTLLAVGAAQSEPPLARRSLERTGNGTATPHFASSPSRIFSPAWATGSKRDPRGFQPRFPLHWSLRRANATVATRSQNEGHRCADATAPARC